MRATGALREGVRASDVGRGARLHRSACTEEGFGSRHELATQRRRTNHGADAADAAAARATAVAATPKIRRLARNSHPPFPLQTAIPGIKTTYEILKEGNGGAKIEKGSTGTLHATGVVKESGFKFWSTKDPGQEPFTCKYGVGQVITGWDQGCLGMTVGEERKLTIPADEGYGAKGFGAWKIPGGATLEFTLECLQIK